MSSLLSNNNKHLEISEHKHVIDSRQKSLIIRDNLYESLKYLSQNESITLNAILQYAWHKVLSIYSSSDTSKYIS